MDEVTIRRAVIADLEAVSALLQDLDDLHRGALPWLLRRVDGPPLTDFLEAYVSKHDYAMFLAVAPEGSLAGVLYMFLRQPARASIVAPTVVAEIDALVVNVAFRRQHIGTRLVQAALNWASVPERHVPNWGSTSSTSWLTPFGLRSASKRCHVASSCTLTALLRRPVSP